MCILYANTEFIITHIENDYLKIIMLSGCKYNSEQSLFELWLNDGKANYYVTTFILHLTILT